MPYIVPNMKLIPQTLSDSCWYASAQMLINWKQEQKQQSFKDLVPPEFDAECRNLRDDNDGINNPQIVAMAKRLGLKAVPPMSPTPGAIEGWLKNYGPLWVNGKKHIVVIAGIAPAGVLGYQLLVYDPWDINVGKVVWRGMSDWYFGSDRSSADTGPRVEAIFLYCPEL